MRTEIKAKEIGFTSKWNYIGNNYVLPIFLGLLSREAIKMGYLLLQDIFTIDMTDADYNIIIL